MSTDAASEAGDLPPPPGLDAVGQRIALARTHAHAGAQIPPEARAQSVKRAVVTAMRPVTSVQSACNDATLDAVEGLRREAVQQEGALAGLRATVTLTDAALDDITAEVAGLREEVARLRAELGALRAERDQDR